MDMSRKMSWLPLVLVWSLSACTDSDIDSELAANRTLWQNSGISNYILNYRP